MDSSHAHAGRQGGCVGCCTLCAGQPCTQPPAALRLVVQDCLLWIAIAWAVAVRASELLAVGGAAELAAAAGEDAGRLLLLRDAAWWLGEHANLAAGEFAGSLPPREERNENEAPEAETTPLEAAALEVSPLLSYAAATKSLNIVASKPASPLQAFRNPQMAAVMSHLQHAALTMPPGPRTAAVQALAKVAVRSEEPYRLQCYSVLASLATASRASEPDAHGVSCAVQPVLLILDMLYSARLVLERLARSYGRQPRHWPPAVVAQLRTRNTLLEQRIQRVICSLSGASYFVLGTLSCFFPGSSETHC